MIVWKGQKEDVQKQQSRILGHVSWCRPVQLQNQGQWLKEPSPPSQLQKTQSPGAVKYDREGWVVRVRGWGHKIWKQTQNWGIQPSHKWSQLWCHLKRGRICKRSYSRDRLNKAPPGFRGGRQVWKFILEVGQMLFSGSPESGHTVAADFLECTEIARSD